MRRDAPKPEPRLRIYVNGTLISDDVVTATSQHEIVIQEGEGGSFCFQRDEHGNEFRYYQLSTKSATKTLARYPGVKKGKKIRTLDWLREQERKKKKRPC